LSEPSPVPAQAYLDSLPPLWPDGQLRAEIARRREASGACVVALDDDPTGTQTVADVQVLAGPTILDLTEALLAGEPALYVLTNSRSLPEADAFALTRALAADLTAAARRASRPLLLVSRSDSTLRGHFPAEVDALRIGAGVDRPALLIPFFAEGGRYTIGDVHWVREGQTLVPAAQTAFARDPVFGYRHSRLPEWVEEKSAGRLVARDVSCLSVDALRRGGPPHARRWLDDLRPGQIGVANAAHDRDLEVLAAAIHQSTGAMPFFRSAASWVKVLAGLPNPASVNATLIAGGQGGGLTIVGSVVPRTDEQLAALHRVPGLAWIELSVGLVIDPGGRGPEVERVTEAVMAAWSGGLDAVVFTTRAPSAPGDLGAGRMVSAALVEAVRALPIAPRYLIGKGGITASDLATGALGMRSARVLGPILPGVPVWRMGPETRWPGIPLIVFPGNVGEGDSLAAAVEALRP
jgi:uncharacterized protein YgbK (DUF1537 family)